MSKKQSIAFGILSLLCCSTAFAEDVSSDQVCDFDLVKVCFADGDCYCSRRVVDLEDPVPSISACSDPDDTGACSN